MVITEADIGKFCKFWNRADNVHYGILVDVTDDGKFTSNNGNNYDNATVITLEEFKIIQGVNSQQTYAYKGQFVNGLFENSNKPTAVTGTITQLVGDEGNE